MQRTRFGADLDMYFGSSILSAWPEVKAAAIQKAEEVITIIDQFNTEERSILTSPLLTPKGQTEQLSRLALDSKRQLDSFEASTVTVLKKRVADAIASVTAAAVASVVKREAADALVHELRARETRDFARNIDALMLRAKYLAACKTGEDDGLVSAIESAPSQAALLDPAVIQEGKQLRAQRLRPDTEMLEHVTAFHGYVLSSARNEVARHLPPREPELIRVVAQ